MIIYATKQTFERYNLKLPSELTPPVNEIAEAILDEESGDRLLEWGAKLFYFDRRKSIQLVNFASKLTLFLVDIKVGDLDGIGDMIAHYLLEFYKDDNQATLALRNMFEASPMICFTRLTDKSIVSTLNSTERWVADDGYRLYDYIEDGVLLTMKFNYEVNFVRLFSMKTDGKNEYYYAGEMFKKMLLERDAKHKQRNISALRRTK